MDFQFDVQDAGEHQRKRVTLDNKYFTSIQVKDLENLITDDCIAVIDCDTIPYRGAALQDENYIVARHIASGREKEFPTKTKFKGAAKTEGKISQNSWLGTENLKRESEGKPTFKLEDFEIIPKKRLKKDQQTSMVNIKKFVDDYINEIKFQTGCKEVLVVLGGGDNHRHELKLPEIYKGNRDESTKPLLIEEARQYVMDTYPHEMVVGIEADDRCQALGFEGYKHFKETGKFNKILVALDKDAQQSPCLLFNYNKKGKFWVHPNPILIDDWGDSVGTIEMFDGACKCTGLMQIVYQAICGDSSDHYHSYLRFPKEMHPEVPYSDASFFKDFYPLKTQQEVLQKLVDKFYDFFPEGLKYTAWDGTEMDIETVEWLDTIFQCVYMLLGEDDKTTIQDLLVIFGVDYSSICSEPKNSAADSQEEVQEAEVVMTPEVKEISCQNELSHDLGQLQEECAEIIQTVNKIRRFGMYEQHPDLDENNVERLQAEVKDLLAAIVTLETVHGIDLGFTEVDEEHIHRKNEKVDKYKGYSRNLGLLED